MVNITWETATEKNNDFFTIERSINAGNFESIAYKQGAGNSNTETSYSIIDKPDSGGIHYYRLKQTDYNGNYSYSYLISINYDIKHNILDGNMYYNDGNIILDFNKQECSNINLSLYTINGINIFSKNYSGISEIIQPINTDESIIIAIIKYNNRKQEVKKLYIGH